MMMITLVGQVGIEPTTKGLWVRRRGLGL